MTEYYDLQTLTIKKYDTPSNDTLRSIISLDCDVDDKLFWDIKNTLETQLKEGYEIESRRKFFECGASMSGYDIVIALFIGLGANFSYDIVKAIIKVATKGHTGPVSVTDTTIDEHIEEAKNTIIHYFLPDGDIELIDIDKKVSGTHVILMDEKKNKYDVKLLPEGIAAEVTFISNK